MGLREPNTVGGCSTGQHSQRCSTRGATGRSLNAFQRLFTNEGISKEGSGCRERTLTWSPARVDRDTALDLDFFSFPALPAPDGGLDVDQCRCVWIRVQIKGE